MVVRQGQSRSVRGALRYLPSPSSARATVACASTESPLATNSPLLWRPSIPWRQENQDPDESVHFQVFVTPTWPYCPGTVVLMHKMAVGNDNVRADMVEATQLPQLALNYQVGGAPRTVINQNRFVEGMVPQAVMLQMLLIALGKHDEEGSSNEG